VAPRPSNRLTQPGVVILGCVALVEHLRSSDRWRRVARRLPLTGSYERRLEELRELVYELDEAQHRFQWRPAGHYYSPIPNLDDLADREDIFAVDPTDVPGVDLRIAEQWQFLEELHPYAAEVPFPDQQSDGFRFWFDNDSYGHGDGTTLYSLLRHLRPARMIEVGAGYSTLCSLDTIERYELGTRLSIVEPYPDRVQRMLRPGDVDRIEFLSTPVERLDLSVFDELQSGDVLFIDSTHVAKTGGDVVHELHRVLPRLAPGVVIHFHDIFPGFEYPESWVFEGRGWNEAYALRAFLQFNPCFQIQLWPIFLRRLNRERAEALMPPLGRNDGGCFWMRRTA
jgi:predicted O-methyltransferase YrrM